MGIVNWIKIIGEADYISYSIIGKSMNSIILTIAMDK